MKYSENYKFALPTAEDDDLADIGVISENFKTVDRVMKKNENLEVELNRFEHETTDAVGRLNAKDADLQSQINMLSGVDMSEFQAQLDNKSDATNLVNGSAEGSLRSIGATEEDDTYTMGWRAFAEGNKTTASGNYSHAEGNNNTASGVGSHAEGSWATASGGYSHAEGLSTTASGEYSHAEGSRVESSGECSHAEGRITTASGDYSHAEGHDTTASGGCSHAEGLSTTASGEASHAEGLGTIAGSYCQHAQGKCNIADNDDKYLHIVGNGSGYETRSNAHTLDWDGNAWFAGDVYVGGTSQDDENAINLVNISTENKTDIESLKAKDTDLQSQINTKVTRKVAILGSDTGNSAGWYKVASGTMTKWTSLSLLFAVHTPATSGKHSGILQLDLRGGTEAIEIGDTLKLGWLVRAGFDLSQVIVVVDGYDWELYYKVQSYQFFRAFFEVIQESNDVSIDKAVYTLHTDSVVETTAPVATAISVDLGTVNTANKLTTARNINGIAFDGSADINITANDIASTSGQTLYQTIVDLTARIEALENSASGSTITRTLLIDWDVNTNGSTQGTVSKDADGLHASGSTSMRIANYWSNNVSAYDGITFTAYGSGKLRVEVGGVESSYVVLSTTPTTFTFDFAENGLTDLSSVEINLQTQGVYDLTVSDIYGYTKS